MTHDHPAAPGGHLSEDALVLHYYADTEPDLRPSVEAHLAACEECRAALTRLTQVLALVESHVDTPAPDGFERVMWARVQEQLPASRAAGWRRWLLPRSLTLAGAAAVLVLAAFVAGRWSSGPPGPPGPGAPVTPADPSATPSAAPGSAPDRVLLVAVGEHLDRSQMVLVELLNQEPGAGIGPAGDRERAADLVAANRLIRQSADLAGEAAVSGVLDDLERVLIEIANGSDETSAEELQQLRTRIESRGILFRMRVITSDVRERQQYRPGVPRT